MTEHAHLKITPQQISELTSTQNYRMGMQFYKENRVFECYESQG